MHSAALTLLPWHPQHDDLAGIGEQTAALQQHRRGVCLHERPTGHAVRQ